MTKQTKPANPIDLLLDPTRLVVSLSQASEILGIAKSTGHNAYKATGLLMEGVPVLKVGKRRVISTMKLRSALGIEEPAR
jgi:hypothetical protein